MSALKIIVTTAGRAALLNAAHNGTLPMQVTQCGVTATAFTADKSQTALAAEIKRIPTLAGGATAPDTLHVTINDSSTDTYSVRGLGLYLGDGTLFAVYSQTDVLVEKSAQASMLLAADVQFADIDATQLTFGNTNFQLNAATTLLQGVVELATDAETADGTDAVRAVTPHGLSAAVDARFGAGAPSIYVKGLLTSATAPIFRTSLGLKGAATLDPGAGNNLDADMLDGQHGAYYSNFANLGNVPETATRWPAVAEVTGLQGALNGKQAAGTYIVGGDGVGLANGVNLSDVTATGVYYKGSVPLPADTPTVGAFKLLDIGPSAWNSQLVFDSYTSAMWLRSRTASMGAFGPWYSLWTAANFNPSSKLDATATAVAATKLATARNLSLTGVITAAAASFDGTGDVALATAIADGALTIAKTNGLQTAIIAAQTTAQTYADNRFVVPSTSGVLNWNDLTNCKPGAGATLLRGIDATNAPPDTDSTKYYYPFNISYGGANGAYIFQFALPYSQVINKGSGPFFRSSYSGTFSAWYKLWGSHNHGIGSGLDADLLQGVNGANYTRADLTYLGVTGSVSMDSVTNTSSQWSQLPVGYARMMNGVAIGTNGGVPVAAYGYFFKLGTSDQNGGWVGLWAPSSPSGDTFLGVTYDSSTLPTWLKVWTSASFTPSSKLDATATAVAATKLATARSLSLTGPVTAAAVSFDGTGNAALATVIADGALSVAKTSGLQAALDAKAPLASPTFTGTVSLATLAASGAITGATVRATGTIMAAGGFQIG